MDSFIFLYNEGQKIRRQLMRFPTGVGSDFEVLAFSATCISTSFKVASRNMNSSNIRLGKRFGLDSERVKFQFGKATRHGPLVNYSGSGDTKVRLGTGHCRLRKPLIELILGRYR